MKSLPHIHFINALITPYFLVEMISKSFIALFILALTCSVNAAAIAPRQPVGGDGGSDVGARDCQFLLGLVVREGLC